MISVPSGVRVWLAVGRTDMRRGMNGLALQVQEALRRDPHAGDLFVFRGGRGDLIKIIWHDGLGMSYLCNRVFRWRHRGGSIHSQLEEVRRNWLLIPSPDLTKERTKASSS
jgi:transposase